VLRIALASFFAAPLFVALSSSIHLSLSAVFVDPLFLEPLSLLSTKVNRQRLATKVCDKV